MAEAKVSEEELLDLRNQITMAEKLVEDKLLPQMREAIHRYVGTHVPVMARDWDIILNDIYPIIQYELPSIFFRNPKVYLRPRNKTFIVKKRNPVTGAMEDKQMDSGESAKTQEAILNYVLSEIRFKEEVRQVLTDALIFKHGILWHGYKGNFGMTEEQSLYIKDESVFVKRISPLRFLFDPNVTLSNIDEGSWVGRSFDVPLNDLLEDGTLDVDKKMLKGKLGYSIGLTPVNPNLGGGDTKVLADQPKSLIDYADPEFRNSNLSKFVRVYEILKRPTKKEARNGETGKMILITKEQKKPLRVSNWPYKAEGWPAKILQFNYVPDSVFGLSDLEVFQSITDQKNMIINMQLRNAQENSKVYVGISKEGAVEEDITKMQNGDQTIITFDSGNPRDRMSVQSAGGSASSELYLIDQRVQANLDEKSGVSDLKKGFLRSGEESAASVQIRNAGASARPAYRQDIMSDFLRNSTHYINQLCKQFFPVNKAVRIVGSLDIQWSENPSQEEVQADTDVEIDVISMLPENPEDEIVRLNTIMTMMVNAINDPAVQAKIQQEGNTFNLSPIIEELLIRLRIKDPDVFRKIKPEESLGFVHVKDIRDAEANVHAALGGQEPPVPPQAGQDHQAHLEVYGSIATLIQELGQTKALQALQGMIQAHGALQQEEQEKSGSGISGLKKPQGLKKPFINVGK